MKGEKFCHAVFCPSLLLTTFPFQRAPTNENSQKALELCVSLFSMGWKILFLVCIPKPWNSSWRASSNLKTITITIVYSLQTAAQLAYPFLYFYRIKVSEWGTAALLPPPRPDLLRYFSIHLFSFCLRQEFVERCSFTVVAFVPYFLYRP